MTKHIVKQLIARNLTWPPDKQSHSFQSPCIKDYVAGIISKAQKGKLATRSPRHGDLRNTLLGLPLASDVLTPFGSGRFAGLKYTDSLMTPIFWDGDIILIDQHFQDLNRVRDEILCFQFVGTDNVYLARFERKRNGSIMYYIFCDDGRTRNHINVDDTDVITVHGRVHGAWHGWRNERKTWISLTEIRNNCKEWCRYRRAQLKKLMGVFAN